MKRLLNRTIWLFIAAFLWIALVLSKTVIFPKFWSAIYAAGMLGRASGYYTRGRYKESIPFYEKVIEYGSEFEVEMACETLGKIHEEGLGVEKDMIKAEEYYLRAGSRGNTAYEHKVATKSWYEEHWK